MSDIVGYVTLVTDDLGVTTPYEYDSKDISEAVADLMNGMEGYSAWSAPIIEVHA